MNNLKVTVFAGLSVLLVSSHSVASEPLALQKIMADIGSNMERIVHGIAREDWMLVEQAADKVANHPTPPMTDKVRILSYVGTDMATFKSLDSKTHDSAIVLGQEAAKKDGAKVIAQFADLQNTCLACHQRFRQAFKAHFYGEK
ncbi:cytochrome c [sulfur-oxidizing endosymbiont of Gigantopelta aegis]|uniref:cytochrome c n=1 Tax=sulfur-oxidizing endosymbiont of Gigantopelta aegis TaxID=2794934 RepID=UPI001FEB70AB|nr:cytochrome c [sulfur-oxidizing endosymbiont of Gigantopelta aegis]